MASHEEGWVVEVYVVSDIYCELEGPGTDWGSAQPPQAAPGIHQQQQGDVQQGGGGPSRVSPDYRQKFENQEKAISRYKK